jgi:sulfite reductase beta subunit-like hemoprotein
LAHDDDSEFAHWVRTNIFAQKQHGYYGATVQLPLGEITGSQLRGVAALAHAFSSGHLRASTDQNLVIPWIPGGRLHEFYRGLAALDLAEADALRITDVTSCPGGDYCSLAVSRSMCVGGAIRTHLRATDGQVEDLGPFRIKISGCPNSCGQHHVGGIGLTGLSVKREDGTLHAHYSMLVGGRVGEGRAAIGKRVAGRFPEEEVPKVVAALAEYYRGKRQPGEGFDDFVQRVGADRLAEVARGAAAVVR